ncbi:MAG: hypothetical protein NDJ65_05125 [Paludibacteraceae bacterium]|nr:hypothetical protein [Paludibacteraceae bacterium]
MQNNDSRDIVICVLKLDYHHAKGERSTPYSVHDLYDTVMHADKKDYEFAKIEQGQTKKFFWWRDEDDILRDTITFFILDRTVYETHDWATIVENNEVLARYDVPGFIYEKYFDGEKPMTYPPSKEMSDFVIRIFNGE